MEEKMKKMLFLMLFLLILGAANVTSQVRIGGNGVPNGAAVLDLNATDATNTGTKGLALPRVSLANNTVLITSGTPNLSGMLVYNTNTALGAGVYYWDGSNWVKVSDGAFTEVDGVVGNEVTNATTNGGLVRAGSGTTSVPYTLGIATGGIQTGMIADAAITTSKVANGAIDTTKLSTAGIVDGSFLVKLGGKWVTKNLQIPVIDTGTVIPVKRAVSMTLILDTVVNLPALEYNARAAVRFGSDPGHNIWCDIDAWSYHLDVKFYRGTVGQYIMYKCMTLDGCPVVTALKTCCFGAQ